MRGVNERKREMTEGDKMLAAAVLNARAAVLSTEAAAMASYNLAQHHNGGGRFYDETAFYHLVDNNKLNASDVAKVLSGDLT